MSFFTPLRPILGNTAAPTARTFSTTAQRAAARMTITGRLAFQPELHTLNSGQEVVRYGVIPTTSKRTEAPSYFRISGFLPESRLKQFILGTPKGSLVFVEADAQTRTVEDAEGRKVGGLSLKQLSFELLARPRARLASEEPEQQPESEHPEHPEQNEQA